MVSKVQMKKQREIIHDGSCMASMPIMEEVLVECNLTCSQTVLCAAH